VSRAGARAALVAAVASVAGAAACGTPSPDLFVVDRGGSVPGAELDLLVSDGTVRCNGAEPEPLSSDQLLEARDITGELLELQESGAQTPRGEAEVFSFAVTTEAGVLRFSDTAAEPEVLGRVSRFTRTIAQDVCGLER
jgi:hypothetical protein